MVGTTTATCSPAIAATKAARNATSVLPKPTSPQTSRSIGRPLRQILDRVGDGLLLILGLLIGKARAEFVIEAVRRIDRRQRFQLARGGDADQFGRDLAHPLLHARLALLPAGAAQPVELRAALVRAVARQQFDILDRQEQLAAVILQFQAVMRRAQRVDGLAGPDSARRHARYG